jgi:ABC-2 type transport system ATP-binding protein
MNILSLKSVTKAFKEKKAVDNISFDIPAGSMFGLLGPNGAGKTTLLRMITTITGPDSGEILFKGERLGNLHPERMGYLPEERGLYKKMKVGEQLIYLARLKGLSGPEAKKRIRGYMEKFEITEWWNKKVNELSKGMQQKVQFVSTIVHEPELIILDEPFSGLDPINTRVIKNEIKQLNKEGTTIIFSTHRMEQVEELCQQILLINDGKKILEGEVTSIKNRYKQNEYRVTYSPPLPNFEVNGIDIRHTEENEITVKGEDEMRAADILKTLINEGLDMQSFNEVLPTLNDIFIQTVNESDHV